MSKSDSTTALLSRPRGVTSFLEASLPNGDRDHTNGAVDPEPTELELLQRTALTIEAIQQSLRPSPSDAKFCAIHKGLGSPKTYRVCRTGGEALARLDAAHWLASYRAVLGQLQRRQVGSGAEPIYADFDSALRVRAAFIELKAARDKGVVVIIEGGSGSGKTEAMKVVAETDPEAVCWVEASESWDSLNAALGDVLSALGEAALPVSTAQRLQRLTESLKRQHRFIFIDEGEQLTRRFLNVVKEMVNRTSAKFLIAANPTRRWNQLLATEEATQILHNRLCSRVQLTMLDGAQVGMFINRRLGLDLSGPKFEAVFNRLASTAQHHGHGSFLRKLVSSLQRTLAENPEEPISPQCLLDHADSVRSTMKGRPVEA